MAAIEADAFLLPLFDSPRREKKAVETQSQSVLGRRPTATRPSQSLTDLLDDISDDGDQDSGGDEPKEIETSNKDKDSDNLLYDAPRKKVKHRHTRIARPRDSMPGYRRNRWGGKGRGGKFRYRGNRGGGTNANPNVGANYLNRGSSAAAYYGDGSATNSLEVDAANDERVGGEDALANELTKKEREGLATREGDVGTLSELAVPICSGHSKPCKKVTAKRGDNKGRAFFVCAHERRFDRCDFFKWADAPSAVVEVDDYGGFACVAGEKFVVPPAVAETNDIDAVANKYFDINELRPQQRHAVELLRDGNSVLTILPTGGGKSLVYQMLAALTPGLVLVITPLVSLMRDQELRMPKCLPCACLRGSQPNSVVEDIERRIQRGELKVLLVSPERLFAPRFRALIQAAGDDFFSAIVIDEAHCISEWSHNFRTSYLRLSLGIKQAFRGNSPRILALTATATTPTEKNICELLNISPQNVVRACTRRENLTLGVTQVRGNSADAKPHELVRVLSMEPYTSVLRAGIDSTPAKTHRKHEGWGDDAKSITKRRGRAKKSDAGSVLIYVSKQRECGSVCNFLKSSNLRFGRAVSMYHAGLSSYERDKTQKDFQEGRVCVLVATVAFGMGLNVANVRAVIHYDAPFSLESYAQEVGRAGRDGEAAVCHALVSTHDKQVLVSRAHSDGVEPSTVRKFVVALVGSRVNSHDDAETTYMCLPYSVLESVHDMYAEGAETVVALLERSVEGVELLAAGHVRVVVQFFTHSPEILLREPHAENLTLHEKRVLRTLVESAKQKNGLYELDLPKVGLLEEEVTRGLRKLARSGALKCEVRERALRVRCTKDAAENISTNAAKLATEASTVLARIEGVRVTKAKAVCEAFGRAEKCLSACEQSGHLHDAVEEYFNGKEYGDVTIGVEDQSVKVAIGKVLGATAYGRKVPRTPREVARILHGIQSAAFTAKAWYSCGQWRRWTHVPFDVVKETTAEMIRDRVRRGRM